MYHKEFEKYLLSLLLKKQIRYELDEFPSGCKMIDIWHNDDFYVVQIDPAFVGFSRVTDETGFDTNPDLKFVELEKFKNYIEKVFSDKPQQL